MKNRKGFTLVEIMIVVAIIALLAAIAVPSFVSARERSMQGRCVNNLRLISGAKDQYALQNDNTTPTALSDLTEYFAKEEELECPAKGNYTLNALDADPTCDYNPSKEQFKHVLNPEATPVTP